MQTRLITRGKRKEMKDGDKTVYVDIIQIDKKAKIGEIVDIQYYKNAPVTHRGKIMKTAPGDKVFGGIRVYSYYIMLEDEQ